MSKVRTGGKYLWFVSSVLVPIITTVISAGVIYLGLLKPTAYVYKEVPVLDEFDILDYFPLEEGNYWDYKMDLEYQDVKGIRTYSDTVRMTVHGIYKKDYFTLIEMKGNPFDGIKDLDSTFGYLIFSNNVYWLNKIQLDRLKQSKEVLQLSFKNYELLFDFPLFEGQRYGNMSEWIANKYNNVVEKSDYYIKQVGETVKTRPVYTIHLVTTPDKSRTIFVPYLGISSYEYHHNGTVNDIKVQLIDYNLKNEQVF